MPSVSKERIESLIIKVKRLDAYQEIQNNMGRCMAGLNFQNASEILKYFALEEQGVSLEFADEGVFVGKVAVETIVRELVKKPEPGIMIDLQLTTPIIEVAADLKTARALWWCPGAGAIKDTEASDPRAIWAWGMLAADFVNLDGEWKIWHLHYFRLLNCDYKKGWVEDISMINRPNTAMHPLAGPSSYHNPYSPVSIREGIPAAPRPYELWEQDNWMLRRDKTK